MMKENYDSGLKQRLMYEDAFAKELWQIEQERISSLVYQEKQRQMIEDQRAKQDFIRERDILSSLKDRVNYYSLKL